MPTGISARVSAVLRNGTIFLLVTRYHSHYQIRGVVIILGLIAGMVAAVFLYTLPLSALHARLGALYMSFFYLSHYLSLGFITQNIHCWIYQERRSQRSVFHRQLRS